MEKITLQNATQKDLIGKPIHETVHMLADALTEWANVDGTQSVQVNARYALNVSFAIFCVQHALDDVDKIINTVIKLHIAKDSAAMTKLMADYASVEV